APRATATRRERYCRGVGHFRRVGVRGWPDRARRADHRPGRVTRPSKRDTQHGYDEAWLLHREARRKYDIFRAVVSGSRTPSMLADDASRCCCFAAFILLCRVCTIVHSAGSSRITVYFFHCEIRPGPGEGG